MNERLFLLLVICGLILGGVGAGGFHFVAGGDSWSPRDYTAKPGGVIVYPQGDPIYDEHYAKNVNVPNAGALLNQSKSKLYEAQAYAVESQATQTNIALSSFAAVVVLVILLILLSILR